MSFRTSACPCDRRSPTKFTTRSAGAIGSARTAPLPNSSTAGWPPRANGNKPAGATTHLNARGLAVLRASAQISNADNSAEYLPSDATSCGCNALKFSTKLECLPMYRFNPLTLQRYVSSIAVVIIMAMMAVVSSTPVVRGVSVATVI